MQVFVITLNNVYSVSVNLDLTACAFTFYLPFFYLCCGPFVYFEKLVIMHFNLVNFREMGGAIFLSLSIYCSEMYTRLLGC